MKKIKRIVCSLVLCLMLVGICIPSVAATNYVWYGSSGTAYVYTDTSTYSTTSCLKTQAKGIQGMTNYAINTYHVLKPVIMITQEISQSNLEKLC